MQWRGMDRKEKKWRPSKWQLSKAVIRAKLYRA
jgi:hypothetical protein